MFIGIKEPFYPTAEQQQVLNQWIGCFRFIWNAKVQEDQYYYRFASKFFPKEYAYKCQDYQYSRFKNRELSPWLYQVPSQILRNAAKRWHDTKINAIKGICGHPKIHRKQSRGSVYLTNELFSFEFGKQTILHIGTKKYPVGSFVLANRRKFTMPKSITVVREGTGKWFVCFGYDKPSTGEQDLLSLNEHLTQLRLLDDEDLQAVVVGLDMGVAVPVASSQEEVGNFTYDQVHQHRLARLEHKKARLQKKLSRQELGSNRRERTKRRLAKVHADIANIRNEFAHQTSRKIVDSDNQVFVFEKLNTKGMTKRAKSKQDPITGKWLKNGQSAKSGLNKAILNIGWHKVRSYTIYKAERMNKAVFTIPAPHTSQACAKCGHTHPDNRKTQDVFCCIACGHKDNADHNAACVIANIVIKSIKHTGTVLDGNLLKVPSIGHRENVRRLERSKGCNLNEVSKKTESRDSRSHAL